MLKNYNLKRPWVNCMSDSSLNCAWQLHQVPSCKRIHLSFAWNQHLLSSDKICWTPIGWWCQKQLSVAFVVLKTAHCFFAIDCPLENFLMPTGYWICRVWIFLEFIFQFLFILLVFYSLWYMFCLGPTLSMISKNNK